jgi:hypothetical protein
MCHEYIKQKQKSINKLQENFIKMIILFIFVCNYKKELIQQYAYININLFPYVSI